MATQVKFRRGTAEEHGNFTGAIGEVTVDTSSNSVRVHDGITVGGHLINKSGVIFETIADIDSGNSVGGPVSLSIGDTVIANDYAEGNGSGVLFFKVVAGGTGTVDGGKYIDLASGLQLEQNMKTPYNIKAWGLAGDGTDETGIIQTAMAYAPGVYTIPSGTYMIDPDAPIDMVSEVILTGVGASTILKALPTSSQAYEVVRSYTAKNANLMNMTIIGDRDTHTGTEGEAGHGILVGGTSQNITIYNVTVEDCWGDGFYIGAGDVADLRNITVDRCVANNNRRQGCSITSGQYITIKNSEFKNTNGTAPQTGIDIEPNVQNDPTQKCRYITLENNRCVANAGSGIIAEGREIDINSLDDAGLLYFTISNNKCASNGVYGIHVTNSAFGVIDNNQSSSNTHGIRANIAVYNNEFSNNVCAFNTIAGIEFAQGCFNNSISDNTVSENPYSIVVAGGSDKNSITGNTITEGETGILVSSSGGNTFSSNTIKNTAYSAIYVSGTASQLNYFTNNRLIDCSEFPTEVAGRNYGADICLTTEAAYNLFKDNMITHSTTQPYSSYYYCRNVGSDYNKFVYDQLGNTTLPRLVVSGASANTNEVIELNSLLSYPWDIA